MAPSGNRQTVGGEETNGQDADVQAHCKYLIAFVLQVPNTIEQAKIEHIQSYGGEIIKTDLGKRLVRARQEADTNGGFFMNQFANSDKAEEYHESDQREY
ncbi:unnamed protein product [Gongylonema pulchrum]|uniref:RRM domain-containing protein n=1 Tax=Gongylonema pulchrum TaxID=637853 RepID=A0A183EFB9_9BILA|nr:unnamed protein product [Gongylonema pulchrum]